MGTTLRVKVEWSGETVGFLASVLDNERYVEVDTAPTKKGIDQTIDLPRPDDARIIWVLVGCTAGMTGIKGTVTVAGGPPIKLEGPDKKTGVWAGKARVIP